MFRCLIFAALLTATLAAKSYDGYQVLQITPRNENELSALSDFKETHGDKVDIWQNPRRSDLPFDFMVSPEYRDLVFSFVKARGLDVEILIDDVEKAANAQKARAPSTDATFDYEIYHNLEEINAWMEDMARSSSLVSLESIAGSYEGRTIRALKVGNPSSQPKPVIWLEGGIHAREWISPATMILMTKMLVDGYGNNFQVTRLLNTFDFYIIINYNADGYDYTWTGDRMWRKTRSDNPGSICVGVDPNRNWAFAWGDAGKVPCLDDYEGLYPHSEIEIVGVTSFIEKLILEGSDVKVFIDFHAYGQMWMTPWGYTGDIYPEDYADQYDVAERAVAALTAVHGTPYTYGTIPEVIYSASGSSVDWAYGAANIKYSFAVELRDDQERGTTGFLLPPEEIYPTAEETFEALMVVAQAAYDEL